MTRFCLLSTIAFGLLANMTSAQILFSYEDLDPDVTSPVGNGLTITDTFFDATRPNVGTADVGTGTAPFMSLNTGGTIDVSSFIGKPFSAFAETYIPASSTINAGDSIYLTVDYFNLAQGTPTADDRVRTNNGFFNEGTNRDTWLPLSIDGFVPDMTPNGFAIDSANVQVVITDGGFGGTPNDSGFGTFALLDNFSYTITEPLPPNPVFFQSDNPAADMNNSAGILFEAAVDPNDASNDVGEVLLGGSGNFNNVNIGEPVDVSSFEGDKYRASFDYLVPANTALEQGDDTFYLTLGFNDPISEGIFGGGNSTSQGFFGIDAVADGQWRTLEMTGVIPPDTNGAGFQIVISDDGFPGNPPDAFGTAFFIDNVVFERVETIEGDYNDDGVVDASDYTVWRDNLGAEAPAEPFEYRDVVELSGERSINFAGNQTGGVTQDDYTVWSDNYGTAPAASGAAVPEPGACLLLLAGVTVASLRRGGVARRSEAA